MDPTPITITSKELVEVDLIFAMKVHFTNWSTFNNSQFGIIEHDFFFSVVLEFYSCNRIMDAAFYSKHVSKPEFLMFYFLTGVQIRCITCRKIRGWRMFERLCRLRG